MSYDTSITIDTGKGRHEVQDVGNMTSNIGGMYRRAMPWRNGMIGVYDGHIYDPENPPEQRSGLTGVSGMKCGDAVPILSEGLRYMEDHEEELRELEPDNGWGSYEGALSYLRKIRTACAEHPAGFVEVNW